MDAVYSQKYSFCVITLTPSHADSNKLVLRKLQRYDEYALASP